MAPITSFGFTSFPAARDSDDADSRRSSQALCAKSHFPAPIFGQVLPARVDHLNQSNLLFPAPALDLLLARNGHLHVLVALVVNEAMALIFLGEPFNGASSIGISPLLLSRPPRRAP